MILKNGNFIVKYIDIRRLGDFEYVVVEYDKTGHKLYARYFNEEATDELGDYLRSHLYDCYEIITPHQLRKEISNALDQ